MGLIELIILVAVIGFLAWLAINLIPMPEQFKKVIVGIALFVVFLIIVRALIGDITIPRIR